MFNLAEKIYLLGQFFILLKREIFSGRFRGKDSPNVLFVRHGRGIPPRRGFLSVSLSRISAAGTPFERPAKAAFTREGWKKKEGRMREKVNFCFLFGIEKRGLGIILRLE